MPPSAGKEYTVGASIGTSGTSVVHNANSSDFSDSAATVGTLYYYKIFAYDASHNYAAGVEISATKNANKTIFVNAAANGANDGASWSNAFNDLQLALKPSASVAGDQIVVAQAFINLQLLIEMLLFNWYQRSRSMVVSWVESIH